MMYKSTFLFLSLLFITLGCKQESQPVSSPEQVYQSAKPYTRWWWFAMELEKKDIKHQLQWLKEKGFGGVEISFIYPVDRNPNAKRTQWLSEEWTEAVAYAKQCADSLNMGCDFTFGTLWPFGGTFVPDSDRTMVYGDPDFRQPLRLSWTHPDTGNVLNHLDRDAFERYADTMGAALKPALEGSTSALFCDSWEVETRKIWTDGFGEEFQSRFGYDIKPFMDSIYTEQYRDERYDYMKLVAEKVLHNFYQPFTKESNELGALSRAQCAGSPTDLIRAYANVDVPETEAMLYNPCFSKIVSSAAALSGKKIVSSETFTCLYGWPAEHFLAEQTADLKLVADALFANGVNQIIWHGKPYNPIDIDTNYFYATVHVGKKGNLSDELKPFNQYMTKVSQIMRKGRTYSDVAVYLPLEDSWYAGEYPEEKQMPWSWGAYELRYQHMPEELEGHHPLWVNGYSLANSHIEDGKLVSGDAVFNSLYVDVNHLDIDHLEAVLNVARSGIPVCIRQAPREAGKRKHPEFIKKVSALYEMKNVSTDIESTIQTQPLIAGKQIPAYWARIYNDELYLFLAHPKAKKLTYPLSYGQAYTEETMEWPLTISYNGNRIEYTAKFNPYQSLLLKIDSKGKMESNDITYHPGTPETKDKE